ncbi:protein IQ-DOMAIN 9-like isoform X2 [Apium graveolens]|uniref:protein IQ-DOMAIN 9-like isoform X2 n=1 Tax=Apium graveolens TaxID=4045 RepID=UPI003D78F27E
MRSGDWLKKLIGLKKLKNRKPKYLKGSSAPQNANGLNKNYDQTNSTNISHHVSNGNPGIPTEDLAATRIQSAFRAYRVEWSNGTETMEEVLARIHLREEAAVKRERAMAYAFSHQWRASSNPALGNYELGKAIWGWSWMERWVAARPWESRALVQSSPNKATSSKKVSNAAKNMKSPTMKLNNSVKSNSPSVKVIAKPRKLSCGEAEQEANTKE